MNGDGVALNYRSIFYKQVCYACFKILLNFCFSIAMSMHIGITLPKFIPAASCSWLALTMMLSSSLSADKG